MLTAFAAVTVFTVMFTLGLGIAPRELRWIWQRPGPMIRGLFSVLIAVPALALLVATFNDASPAVKATVLAYLVVSVFAILPYVAWRRRAGKGASQTN
ncbi:MAG: hypothetical protein IT515_04725 [Burkholderiales bacterium]|nr:hypothetical protein [Burkholderiales bacterium]